MAFDQGKSATGTVIHTVGRAPVSTSARPPRWKFWAVAYTMLILLTGTNLATPLYHGYAERFGFSPLMLTLIFAAYVAALIPSLLVAGPLADAAGGRAVLVPAIALAALGSLAFALAQGTAWLFAARVLQGIAVGTAFGRPDRRADRARTAGPPSPGSVGVHRGVHGRAWPGTCAGRPDGPVRAGAASPAVRRGDRPARARRSGDRGGARAAPGTVLTHPVAPPPAQVPAHMRGVFAASAVPAFLAFAVIGLFLTLIPTYVAALARSGNLLLAGAAVALMLACSIGAQFAGYGRPARALQRPRAATAGRRPGAARLDPRGLIPAAAPGLLRYRRSWPGPCLPGRPDRGDQYAPPERRTEVLSTFYMVIYLGVGVPVIGVGFLANVIGLLPAVQWFAAVAALPCLAVPLCSNSRSLYSGRIRSLCSEWLPAR